MIITLDARALILWSSIQTDELTLARLDHLLASIPKGGAVLLPTPAVAELLVKTDHASELWLAQLQRKLTVRIGPFDLRAAAECARMHRATAGTGRGKRANTKPGEPYQKIKIDRQIAAIAKVHGSDRIVTDDENLAAIARSLGISAVGVDELDLPDSARQGKFAFDVALPGGDRPQLLKLPLVEHSEGSAPAAGDAAAAGPAPRV